MSDLVILNEIYLQLSQPGWSIENAELCRLLYLVSDMNTAPGLAELTGPAASSLCGRLRA